MTKTINYSKSYNIAVKYLKDKYGNIDNITNNDDYVIKLLLNQYQFGFSIRKELYNKLLTMNIIKL